MKITLFMSETQLLLIPTVGVVSDNHSVYLTFAFLCWGLAIKLFDEKQQ